MIKNDSRRPWRLPVGFKQRPWGHLPKGGEQGTVPLLLHSHVAEWSSATGLMPPQETPKSDP